MKTVPDATAYAEVEEYTLRVLSRQDRDAFNATLIESICRFLTRYTFTDRTFSEYTSYTFSQPTRTQQFACY